MEKGALDLLKEQIINEPFSNHMGIILRDIRPGYAAVEASFSEKMNNIFGFTHGGAIFGLIDVAIGAASNSHGSIALALSMNIIYIEPPKINTVLIAEAKEESRTKHTATYRIEVLQKNENEIKKIAICNGLVYRKGEPLASSTYLNNDPFKW
jgi:acyl-CoA thioesterase